MHTVQFLNLANISNIQLINEAPDAQPPPLPNLNYSKVQYCYLLPAALRTADNAGI